MMMINNQSIDQVALNEPSFIVPEWLYDLAVDDDLVGSAYEATPKTVRASLKKTIACLSCLYGELPLVRNKQRRFRQGITIAERDTPVNFCLVICPANYPYVERFIAALMPAIFAGIETVIPCFVQKKAISFPSSQQKVTDVNCGNSLSPENMEEKGISPALLAAVDIAGIETAYLLSEEECRNLFVYAQTQANGHILELLQTKNRQRETQPSVPYTALFCADEGEGQPLSTLTSNVTGQPVGLERSSTENSKTSSTVNSENSADLFTWQNGLHLASSLKDIWAWPELSICLFRQRSLTFLHHETSSERSL